MELIAQFLLAAASFLAGATQHVGSVCVTVQGPPPLMVHVDGSVVGALPGCVH